MGAPRRALLRVAGVVDAVGLGLVALSMAAMFRASWPPMGDVRVFQPDWTAMLGFLGAALLCAGLLLQLLLAPGRRRLGALVSLLTLPLWFLPIALLGRASLEPRWVARLALPDGRVAALGSAAGLSLGSGQHPNGVWVGQDGVWREVGAWSGAPALPTAEERPRLSLSPDGSRLLLRDAGAAARCWEIGRGFAPCADPAPPG